MEKKVKSIFVIIAIVFFAVFFEACEKQHEPSDLTRTLSEDNDPVSGFSLNLESDSLEEEIEELYFEAKEWEEEEMDVDL